MSVLRQNDPRWGILKLGDGDSTVGGAGCVLVALTEAARFLETRPGLLPPHANEACRKAGAFDGSSLIIHRAAPLLGLHAPLSERITVPLFKHQDLVSSLEAVIADGGCAMLRVQHDKGQHSILCTGLPQTEIPGVHEAVCLDPAPGTGVTLSFPELTGLSQWKKGDIRRYRVIGVRPIRRAAQ